MRKHFLAIVFLTFTANPLQVLGDEPLIPVVPADKVKKDLPAPLPEKNKVPISKGSIKDRTNIQMTPGVNEILEIAIGHLNRIVTPFESPFVTTSSQADVSARDNVVYVGTTQESPVTLFITEKGSEEAALSLTLIPRKIPPREMTLFLDGSSNVYFTANKRAEKWEKSLPYLAVIETLFKGIAKGDVPPGYKFEKHPKGQLPFCRQQGLNFDFSSGQTIIGHNLLVHIGVAKNISGKVVEFKEDTCGDWDVAAVAAYPSNVLEPRQSTEIYVATKKNLKEEIRIDRPSLLSSLEK
jgi:conjugal transfer pilus assembly protein TraK